MGYNSSDKCSEYKTMNLRHNCALPPLIGHGLLYAQKNNYFQSSEDEYTE